MIAVTSSGRSFRALATYLRRGRSGEEWDRVAWTSARHLPTDDPELAATLMRATAEQNTRVQLPVYHLAISFDHTDVVMQAQMESVADAVLQRLGLAEHQAILVAHRDRAHAHVHVLVNRVHPETGRVWERWKDRPIIERVLREQEQHLGLRQVNGRLAPVPGRERPDRVADVGLTGEEARQRTRQPDPLFVERVRAVMPVLRQATSWQAWEATLAEHGLHATPRGQGLVITDGLHHLKASRVARDCSKAALERRFGVLYQDRVTGIAADSPTHRADTLALTIRQYAYAKQLSRAHYDATMHHSARHAAIAPTGGRNAQAAQDDLRVASRRVRQHDLERRAMRSLEHLERAIAMGMQQLVPAELRHLKTLLTDPQWSLATNVRQTARQSVRTIVLGRDDGLGR